MSQLVPVDSRPQNWQLYGGEAKCLRGGTELQFETRDSRQSFNTTSGQVDALLIFTPDRPCCPVRICILC